MLETNERNEVRVKSKHKLFIRADGNSAMGIGHLMRCLSLAQAWKDAGGIVTLITACRTKKLLDFFHSEAISIVLLEEMYPKTQDWETMEKVLNDLLGAWVVVDGYHFDQSYHKRIRKLGNPLIVIDDMRHLGHYHADLILNQNFNSESLAYPCEKYTHLLLGTSYVLLRREFRNLQICNRKVPERCQNVLVSMGGGDPYNLTLKILNALDKIEDKISVKVVLGPTNPNRQSVIDFTQASNLNIHIVEAADNMSEIISQVDLAFTTGGSTIWELCYLGVPSLQIILAKNQEAIARELAKKGVTVNLGWHDVVTEADIGFAAGKLITDADERKAMSRKGQSIVDGKGAERVVSAMLSFRRQHNIGKVS